MLRLVPVLFVLLSTLCCCATAPALPPVFSSSGPFSATTPPELQLLSAPNTSLPLSDLPPIPLLRHDSPLDQPSPFETAGNSSSLWRRYIIAYRTNTSDVTNTSDIAINSNNNTTTTIDPHTQLINALSLSPQQVFFQYAPSPPSIPKPNNPNIPSLSPSSFRGASVLLSPDQLSRLLSDHAQRASIAYIEEDVYVMVDPMNIESIPSPFTIQNNMSDINIQNDEMGVSKVTKVWGLDRIGQRKLPLNGEYTPAYTNQGKGVNVYIIDTGIRLTHAEFNDGEPGTGTSKHASIAWSLYDPVANNGDPHGHGSHTAGIVGGYNVGVAPQAKLFSVQAMDANGGASYSNIIAAMQWVRDNAEMPAILSMSIGGQYSQSIDDLAVEILDRGITIVAAAGNAKRDACAGNQGVSPASTKGVLTVGASDENDQFATFSNYGTCVTLNAPGVTIVSAYKNSDINYAKMSGTSMATPYVTGTAALYLSEYPDALPDEVYEAITCSVTRNQIINVPEQTTSDLLYVNVKTCDGRRKPTLAPTTSVLDTETQTIKPTSNPTATNTATPTPTPTATQAPTKSPTKTPTAAPSKAPTKAPTQAPTKAPTKSSTKAPTKAPTQAPTAAPTKSSTKAPTKAPTAAPIATAAPTEAPTKTPTEAPTEAPIEETTAGPTKVPTKAPTKASTVAPTAAPTKAPTKAPTTASTAAPTETPTQTSTETEASTVAPTKVRTKAPTVAPTTATKPTSAPTPATVRATIAPPVATSSPALSSPFSSLPTLPSPPTPAPLVLPEPTSSPTSSSSLSSFVSLLSPLFSSFLSPFQGLSVQSSNVPSLPAAPAPAPDPAPAPAAAASSPFQQLFFTTRQQQTSQSSP